MIGKRFRQLDEKVRRASDEAGEASKGVNKETDRLLDKHQDKIEEMAGNDEELRMLLDRRRRIYEQDDSDRRSGI